MKTGLALLVLILIGTAGPLLAGTIVYNDLPNPIPQSSPSLGFQAYPASEFGDLIQPVGGATTLTSGTVLMDGEALFSVWNSANPMLYPSSAGWSWPLTLNLYNVDNSSGTPQPGSLITSVTQTFTIPWRPETGGATGTDFLAMFNLPNVAVPSQFIFSIVYNTQGSGPSPTGVGGPYDSLNVGFNDTAPPQVGTRPLPDTLYINTKGSNYTDGGAGGAGTFRQDTEWTPYSIGAEFVNNVAAVPEPATLGLLCGGLLAIGGLLRKRKRA